MARFLDVNKKIINAIFMIGEDDNVDSKLDEILEEDGKKKKKKALKPLFTRLR